ncbi:hypothetical protein [Streptomyces sp. NPDC093060]|uniref:hypothetical protein n=1 Tax=Streptomyces sp. NPDC093060 TaxID=3366019 RepID=UPI003830B8E7
MIPGLIATWILAPGALLVAWTHWRERRRSPAAADYLRTCRRINDLPLATRKENPKP